VKRYSRETRETCEKSGTGEMEEWRVTSERSESRVTCETDEGSRSEVRGFRNFEPRTSNFESRFSRQSRPSRYEA